MTSRVISKPKFSITCHSGTIHFLLPKNKKKREKELLLRNRLTKRRKHNCANAYPPKEK
jgi:hypothetical protein